MKKSEMLKHLYMRLDEVIEEGNFALNLVDIILDEAEKRGMQPPLQPGQSEPDLVLAWEPEDEKIDE